MAAGVFFFRWNNAWRQAQEGGVSNVRPTDFCASRKPKPKWRIVLRQAMRSLGLRGGVRLAVVTLRLLRATWRISRKNGSRFFIQPAIVAFWHGDLLIGATEVLWSGRKDFGTLASRSRDGEVAACLAKSVRVTPIRGGSSRGQIEALREMERWLRAGKSLVVAVDGPRGPRGMVKSGVVLLAARTGVPIIPAAATSLDGNAWIMKSWDKMWIPKWGAKIEINYGDPLRIPANLKREEMNGYRVELEERLWALHGEKYERPTDHVPAKLKTS